ncbi:MAG: tRNA preQ1(34) S-adenosylmethionine ribosyltransferase-isomerase QueA [Planctomycetota bacterium]
MLPACACGPVLPSVAGPGVTPVAFRQRCPSGACIIRTDELDYHLPDDLVATTPCEPRDASRLLVISRSDPARIQHVHFRDLPEFLHPDDVLTRNVSAVLPARLAGRRSDSGGRIDGLFVREPRRGTWLTMLRSNGVLRPGQSVDLLTADADASAYQLVLIERAAEMWVVEVRGVGDLSAPVVLDAIGATPLPPYILGRRRDTDETQRDALDRAWYQTVYADLSRAGSIAAPTAGLHFTDAVLQAITSLGARLAEVVLHVGPGTFKPIQTDAVDEHPMHSETAEIPGSTITAIEQARASSGRSIVVGTTTVRALESLPHPVTDGVRDTGFGTETDLFIRPGFDFRWTDALITNFHLPRSTLLTLVGALLPEGVPRLLEVYREAVQMRYRFYSYGDAMLILP